MTYDDSWFIYTYTYMYFMYICIYMNIHIYIYKCILQHPAIACTSCIKDTVGPNLANPLICWISHYSSQSVRVFTFLSVIPLPDWQVKVNWRIPYYTCDNRKGATGTQGHPWQLYLNFPWRSFTLFHQISQLPCCKWSNTSSDHSVFGNDFCYVQPWFQQETTLRTSSPCNQRSYGIPSRQHAESSARWWQNSMLASKSVTRWNPVSKLQGWNSPKTTVRSSWLLILRHFSPGFQRVRKNTGFFKHSLPWNYDLLQRLA